jgi:hypothetical protein
MSEHHDEFLAEITEEFLARLPAEIDRDRVREEWHLVRGRGLSKETLQVSYALLSVRYREALSVIKQLCELSELDDVLIDVDQEQATLSDKIIDYYEKRDEKFREAVKKGGSVKATRMNILKEETIRLYKQGTWKNATQAAMEITPKIVQYSKGRGDLLPSTQKPLAWIREYIKKQK